MQSTQLSEAETYGEPSEANCWVYEVYASGNLVYVGIADNFERRWSQHVQKSWWVGEIQVDIVQVLGFSTRAEARLEEAACINQRNPTYNTNLERSSYARWKAMVGAGESIVPVARRAFRPTGWNTVPIDANRSLGLDAIGLWHRAKSLLGDRFEAADVHRLHPDPNAWGPFNEQFDLQGPLDQLIALGYVTETRDSEVAEMQLHAEGCE